MHDFRVKSGNDAAADAVLYDYRNAMLSSMDSAYCAYAVKLTLTPGACGASDVEKLRALGATDAQITIATQVISYFNYINRIADGLGVDDEAFMESVSREDWFAKKARDYRSVIDD